MLQLTLDIGQQAQVSELTGSDTLFGGWLGNVLSGVMAVSALAMLIYLLWGGVEWITAGGDSSKISKARDRITQSVIGMIVLASTLAIFLFVQAFIGIQVLNVGGGGGSGSSSSGQYFINSQGQIPNTNSLTTGKKPSIGNQLQNLFN